MSGLHVYLYIYYCSEVIMQCPNFGKHKKCSRKASYSLAFISEIEHWIYQLSTSDSEVYYYVKHAVYYCLHLLGPGNQSSRAQVYLVHPSCYILNKFTFAISSLRSKHTYLLLLLMRSE